MYSKAEFDTLTKHLGCFSSWAIWDENDESSTDVILDNIAKLNSKFVGVGLNISKQ